MTELWEQALNYLQGLTLHGNWHDALQIVAAELRAAKAENKRLKTELSKCAWHKEFYEEEGSSSEVEELQRRSNNNDTDSNRS